MMCIILWIPTFFIRPTRLGCNLGDDSQHPYSHALSAGHKAEIHKKIVKDRFAGGFVLAG